MRNATYHHVKINQRKNDWTIIASGERLKVKRNNRNIVVHIADLKDSDVALCMIEDCSETATVLAQLIVHNRRSQDFSKPYAPLCRVHATEMKEDYSKIKEN